MVRRRILNAVKSFLHPRSTAPQLFKWPEEPLDLTIDARSGYYPGRLGEELYPGYTLKRKLGWGMDSSVWLAKEAK